MDRFSSWPEGIPLNDTAASVCAQALVSHWIARFGIPVDMSSDRGHQLTSQLWSSVAQLLGKVQQHVWLYMYICMYRGKGGGGGGGVNSALTSLSAVGWV